MRTAAPGERRAFAGTATQIRRAGEAMLVVPDDRSAEDWAAIEQCERQYRHAAHQGRRPGDVWCSRSRAWDDLGGNVAEQGDLFAEPTTQAEREHQAQERTTAALKHHQRDALAVWRAHASVFLRRYAADHAEVFADDLWPAGMPQPPVGSSRRALGAVITSAVREGVLEDSGRLRRAASSNGARKTVWRSKVWGMHHGK